MSKYTNGATLGVTARQMQAARLMAQGEHEQDVILAVFGVDKRDPNGWQRAVKTLHRWAKLPQFGEAYRAVVREVSYPYYGRALKRLVEQIDSPGEWIAQGAAREVLTRFTPYIMGEDDKEVVVRVEGLPVLGVPMDNDAAALEAGSDV